MYEASVSMWMRLYNQIISLTLYNQTCMYVVTSNFPIPSTPPNYRCLPNVWWSVHCKEFSIIHLLPTLSYYLHVIWHAGSDSLCVNGWRLLDGSPHWTPMIGQEITVKKVGTMVKDPKFQYVVEFYWGVTPWYINSCNTQRY